MEIICYKNPDFSSCLCAALALKQQRGSNNTDTEKRVMYARREDWHPADIIAALRKRGTSMAALSRQSGLSSSTLANALSRPWPKGEWLIANALNVHPSEIWPSRYFDPVTSRLLDRKKRIRSPQDLKKIKARR